MTDATKPECFSIDRVGRALWMSDANTGGNISPNRCRKLAFYVLGTLLGLRAATDGPVEVDLGDAGIITITHRSKA